MKQEPKTIFEPHPVTPERKKELRAQGYTIIDAVFAPADYVHPDLAAAKKAREMAEADAAAKKALADKDQGDAGGQGGGAASQPDGAPPAAGDGLDALEAEQLHALAKERGVKVHANAGADKVRAALREASA